MLHLLTVKKYPFTIPYIFLAKIGGLFDNFTKKSQFSLSEVAERVAEHFKDGVFEFDFDTEEHIAVEGNTVYHVIPHYAGDDAENVLNKLRRMIAKNLEKM